MKRQPHARLTEGQRIQMLVAQMRKRADSHARRRASYYTDELEDVSINTVRERDEGICHLCQQWVDAWEMSLDHVRPLTRGGSHTYANIKLAHIVCNAKKGSRLMSEINLSEF